MGSCGECGEESSGELEKRLALADRIACFLKNRFMLLPAKIRKDASELLDQWFDRSRK